MVRRKMDRRGCFNRTFMELKFSWKRQSGDVGEF